MLIVYYIVFTQIRISNIEFFWIYISSAIFPFNFMVSNLTSGSGCIVSNAGMVKKIYFPREIIVISQVISSFIVMLMGYSIVLVAVVVSGYKVGWILLMLPVMFIILVMFTLGFTMVVSALTVYVRDVQYFLSSISMVFFFMTPMYFTTDSVDGLLGTIIQINPFTYFVEAFHEIVYYVEMPSLVCIVICVALSLLSFIIGVSVFSKLKKGFAERL